MLRFPVTQQTFTVYTVMDPAIDVEKSDIEQYYSTLDPKHLAVLENQELTKFKVAPLNTSQRARLLSFEAENETSIEGLEDSKLTNALYPRALLVARMGWKEVEGFEVTFDSDDGLVSMDCIDRLGLPAIVFDLSNAIRTVSMLQSPLAADSKEKGS